MDTARIAERKYHAEFLKRHEEFYDQLVRILADCVERDAVDELSLHVTYIGKCIEQALKLRLVMQQMNQRSGNV